MDGRIRSISLGSFPSHALERFQKITDPIGFSEVEKNLKRRGKSVGSRSFEALDFH